MIAAQEMINDNNDKMIGNSFFDLKITIPKIRGKMQFFLIFLKLKNYLIIQKIILSHSQVMLTAK